MWLVRFVAEPQEWRKALARRDDEGPGVLPLIALRALTPTMREQSRISLYRLADEAEAASLAAAFWFSTKEQFALVGVSEDALLAAGGTLENKEPGTTFHNDVNVNHVDLLIDNGTQAESMARLFYEQGIIIPVESKEIKKSIANDNARGAINFKKLTLKKEQPSVNKLCELIEEEYLKIES